MSAHRHSLIMAIVTSVALVLSACTPQGPSQAELTAANEEMHATVGTVADETVAAFAELNPDLTFTLEPTFAVGSEWWIDCSSTPTPDMENPVAVQWLADRSMQVEPAQPVTSLLEGVSDRLIDDGWAIVDEPGTDATTVKLARDGYQIRLAAHDPADTTPARVALNVSSQCIDAPDDFPTEDS